MFFNKQSLVVGLLASMLTLASACAATPESRSTGQTVDDAGISSKVKAALIKDHDTKANNINVDVYQGKVKLAGFVGSAQEKAEATRIAKTVAGVQDVSNNLEVRAERTAGTAIDDGMITAKVKAALIGDSRTKAHQIDVNTNSGIVQLAGFVDDATAKSVAGDLAKAVNGVRSVRNELEVKK
ncbi:MAG TPA: BON domain-containing protein [Steroidobacteraceae bacterium]|nr:BON domain-containing protein [Steroidobacteraceae bacterium]